MMGASDELQCTLSFGCLLTIIAWLVAALYGHACPFTFVCWFKVLWESCHAYGSLVSHRMCGAGGGPTVGWVDGRASTCVQSRPAVNFYRRGGWVIMLPCPGCFGVGSVCIAEMAYSFRVHPVLGCYESSVSLAAELTSPHQKCQYPTTRLRPLYC